MSRIAVPVADGRVCPHFGGAQGFALFSVDEETRAITGVDVAKPPAHERGVFPSWLRSQGVSAVLAGGMGMRALQRFGAYGIEVVMGVDRHDPAALVEAYLQGNLSTTGEPRCGGGLHECGGQHGQPR